MPDKNEPQEPANDEVDTFSRNDAEGRPGPDKTADPASLASGEEDGFQTDTFSRNDGEGLPGAGEA